MTVVPTRGPTRGRLNAHPAAPEARATPRITYVFVGAVVLSVGLPLVSGWIGMYDRVEHWGKLVHAVDSFCCAFIIGLLLPAWRAAANVDLADELATLLTIFAGLLFGVLWEIVEFIRDWVAYSDLQKSNTDTMTDFLCNDVATVIAALIAIRLYCRLLSDAERERLGTTAEWLVDGPSRILDRHGLALFVLALALTAAAVASLWFAGRPVPGIPIP